MSKDQPASQQSIGKYQILSTLGRGAMGVVYKARDSVLGRIVAIKTLRKVLPAELAKGNAALERFKIEARSAGNLRHPNLITIFDFSVEGDLPYLVMDYVEGRTLSAILAEEGRLTPERTIFYLLQIAAGLDYAHSRGVLHRDIKPANILIDSGNIVYVLDFGVASISQSFNAAVKAERGGLVMGTPGYMAPEQILNKDLDHRSDLFSLAVVAFECLTGKRPFPGDTFTAVVENILARPPVSISAILPGVSLSLEAEFERALARKKEDRFSGAKAMVLALAKALGVDEVSARPDGAYIRPRQFSSWKPIAGIGKGPSVVDASEPTEPVRTGISIATLAQDRWRPGKQSVKAAEPVARPAVNLPPEAGRAGDFFAQADSPPQEEEEFSSFFRWGAALVGVLCLALAGFIVYTIFRDSPKPMMTVPSIAELEAPVTVSTIAPHLAPEAVVGESEATLLAILNDPTQNEIILIKTLEEIRSRKTIGAVSAVANTLSHDSHVVRAEGIRTLATLGGPEAVAQLLPLLDDIDPLIRLETAKALGTLGDSRARAYLQARLGGEDDPRVRAVLEQAIEQFH